MAADPLAQARAQRQWMQARETRLEVEQRLSEGDGTEQQLAVAIEHEAAAAAAMRDTMCD